MVECSIDFIGMFTDICPSLDIAEIDCSNLLLLEAAIKGDRTLAPEISDDRFNLMEEVAVHLRYKESDLEFVICSLINEEFKEENSKLNWAVNLFSAIENENNLVEQNNKAELKVRLLNQWHGTNINHFGIVKDILEEKYIISITDGDDYDLVIDGPFGHKEINNKDAFKIFFIGEAIHPKIEGYDLSLGFDYLEEYNNYIRLPLYYLYFGDMISSEYQRDEECNPHKPYFSCFLVSNGKAEYRNAMFHELSSYKTVTSGGPHLNNIGRIIPENETYAFLSQCKFVLAYENDGTYPGYITEKLFQAYFAGSIPIYYSHPSGQQDINQKAIISAQKYNSTQEMINYIIEVDNDEQKYCNIWNNSIIEDDQKNYNVMKDKIRTKMKKIIG